MRWKGDQKLAGQSCGRLDLLMGLVWGLGPEVSKVTYAGQTKIGRSSGNRRRECVRPRSHQRHLFEIYSKGLVGLHMYTDSQRFVLRFEPSEDPWRIRDMSCDCRPTRHSPTSVVAHERVARASVRCDSTARCIASTPGRHSNSSLIYRTSLPSEYLGEVIP